VDLVRRNDTTAGDVLEVQPGPGNRLDPGSPVTITVSEGQELVAVPDALAGQSFDDARAALLMAGLGSAAEENRFDEEVPAGAVVGVADGTPSELERGSTVGLIVSDGPAPRTVPAGLQGSTEAAAVEAIESVQLAVEVNRQFSEDVAEGLVVSVSPGSGSEVPRGSPVTVEVSRGPEPITVPAGLQGSTEAAASEAIEGVDLAVEVNRQFSDDVAEGLVVSVSPGSGSQVPRRSTVTIEVSRGPEPVTVPDVSGTDSPAAAAALLRQAGLVPGQVSGPSEGSPTGTSPSAGTAVAPGTTVDIALG
jgi:eukaryotic-like serine/threonine-protein kinase